MINLKKIIFIIIALFLITGCNLKETKATKKMQKNIEQKKEEKETYHDDNPIKLGLYLYTNNNRVLLSEYTTEWTLNKDLCSLEVYYTNEQNLPKYKQKDLWNNYYNNYQNIDNYKIGYNIVFSTQNKEINKNILSPKDTNEVYDYIQIYLYDDINQTSSWYDHINEEEFNTKTILSSIKLTGSTKTNEIISNITLTAFTYDDNDFDNNNNYRGISKFTTTIKRS